MRRRAARQSFLFRARATLQAGNHSGGQVVMGMVDFHLVGIEGATVYVNPARVNYIRPTNSEDAHTMIYFDKDHSIIVDHPPGDVARALSAP